ncbi:hypothetical protein Ssi03_16320 [Sphaerisporangium siamense]|uniref:Uncharacterized protein n=1 Tax=Sphaerisporangium siamense TaxID=795645 RepID=A0A7W7DAX3_9ACTN|nr:hypothetical protein [Sphaerisporangium siamense]MBB4702605.1 hypothetical protein [Sphaerisporangium siamense]GII83642.1 hypothetical protein Ssi03_16320 [Sphaerisporangium siamense]
MLPTGLPPSAELGHLARVLDALPALFAPPSGRAQFAAAQDALTHLAVIAAERPATADDVAAAITGYAVRVGHLRAESSTSGVLTPATRRAPINGQAGPDLRLEVTACLRSA